MENLPKTRAEAKALGVKHYFTGKPCKNGHIDKRRISGDCLLCAREQHKKHRKKNREKINERGRKYRENNHGEILERERKRREDNREKVREQARKWREDNLEKARKASRESQRKYTEKNREKISDRQRKYREKYHEKILDRQRKYREDNREKAREQARKWREDNREKIRKRERTYRKENPEKRREIEHRYTKNNPDIVFLRQVFRRIETSRTGLTIERIELVHGYSQQEFKDNLTNQFADGMSWGERSAWHIDHVIPIAQFKDNGVYDPAYVNHLSNLAPLWASDNLSKNDDRAPQAEFDAYMQRVEKELGFAPRSLEEVKSLVESASK
ncbi:TPA: hypothetical protein ACX6R8_003765 [Photobacterium damselae]